MAGITLDGMIRKHGEEIGIQKWNALMDKRRKQNTREGFIERHGPEIGEIKYSEFLEKNKTKGTLLSFIRKYGEGEGTKKYYEKNAKLSVGIDSLRARGYTEEEIADIRKKHKENSFKHMENKTPEELAETRYKMGKPLRIDYWIEQGYTEKEAKLALSSRQNTSSLDKFIKRYGEEKGREKYITTNFKKTTATSSVSEEEKYFVQYLDENIFRGNTENIFSYKKRGPCFRNGDKVIIPDLVDNNVKLIIEYYGEFWHMHPDFFSPEDVHPVTLLTAQQTWDNDKERVKYLESLGYKVMVVWGSDFKQNKKMILQEIKKYYEN